MGKKQYRPVRIENPLSPEDFANPEFDTQAPKARLIPARPEIISLLDSGDDEYEAPISAFPDEPEVPAQAQMREPAIEGVTFTDGYKPVGYTYFRTDGLLIMSYLDEARGKSVPILSRVIAAPEDFEKCLVRADRKISAYLRKNP